MLQTLSKKLKHLMLNISFIGLLPRLLSDIKPAKYIATFRNFDQSATNF